MGRKDWEETLLGLLGNYGKPIDIRDKELDLAAEGSLGNIIIDVDHQDVYLVLYNCRVRMKNEFFDCREFKTHLSRIEYSLMED